MRKPDHRYAINYRWTAALPILLLLSFALHAETKPAAVVEPVTNNAAIEEDFTGEEDVIVVSDPLESFNRAIFTFNDKAYVYVLKPVAVGYRQAVPEQGRVSVSNFFSNLLAPVRIVNSALQLKGEDATNEFVRMMINSTLGLAGLFDVAKNDFKIDIKKEDFGQTLGHYGVGNGAYLVLPFLGPSTVRDGFGLLVDGIALDPLDHLLDDETGEFVAVKLLDIETRLSLDKDSYEAIKKDAIDPYIFLRNAYIQFRAGAVEK
jgi:phospholipid-binding lipoprotein MlaA